MKKSLLLFAPLIIAFLFLVTGNSTFAAESITLSPATASCGDTITVSASGLDPNITDYEVLLQCKTFTCGASTIVLGNPSNGALSFNWAGNFDVGGTCGSGRNANAGTYRAFVTWNSAGNAQMSPTSIILSPLSGDCTLTPLLPDPIYTGISVLYNLTDGNLNTSYDFNLDGQPFTSLMTTMDGELGLNLQTFSSAGTHTVDAISTFPDPNGQRNCSATFTIVSSPFPPPPPQPPGGSIPPAQTACFVPAPTSGTCTVTGRASTAFSSDLDPDHRKRYDKDLQGLGIAWIDEPIIPNEDSDETVETYKYTVTDANGYFKLEGISCEPVHIGIFCGSRVLDTYGIEFDLAGNAPVLKLRYAEQLNCGSNDYCVRSDPDDSPIACGEKEDPEQLEVRYPWGGPEKISGFAVITECFKNTGNFLLCLNKALTYWLGDNSLQATEFNLDRVARIESTKFALGCAPEGVVSCEEIKQINKDSSGINLGRCGRSWVMGKDPSTITETCRIPYDSATTGTQDVCTQPNGDIVKFNEIQLPNTNSMDSNDVLSSEYFPYYLCFQDPGDNGRAEAETIPTASVDEEYTCSGTNCTVGSDPTTEEGSTTSVITKDGTASLETANRSGLSLAGMYSRPGKDVTQKTAPPSGSTASPIESGITRTRWYGTECTCPEEKKDPNDPSKCLEGGVTYSLAQALANALCSDPSNPCSIPNFIPISIESKVPYVENFSSFGMVADYIKRPGQTTPYNSCGGTTSGDTEETADRTPFSSDACATPLRAKEDIMDTFKLNNFDVGN